MPAGAPVMITADLHFEAAVDGRRGGRPTSVAGSVRADGTMIFVDLSRTPSLLGTGTSAARTLAAGLAAQGLGVQVNGPAGRIVTMGAGVTAPWWQRLATGSPYLRLGSLRAVVSSLTGPALLRVAQPALPRRSIGA